MQLIRDSFYFSQSTVVTIGNFDGMHKGHARLIETVIAASRALQAPSVLITFEPHPTEFFSPQKSAPRLMRFREKWRDISALGVDYFYCIRFTALLANLSADAFVKNILVDQLRVKKIIIGDNFRFGAKRLGDVQLLKSLGEKYGFEVEALSQSMYNANRISSTRVREALKIGDFKTIVTLTGRPFTLSGKVAYGDQMGRQLGFPTANIYLHRKQVPLMGIFVVRVHGLRDHAIEGVASIGYRPTFNGKKIVLEVFLFDFNEVIYGRYITVEFLFKIREELKFNSVDELIKHIESDVALAKKYFMRTP